MARLSDDRIGRALDRLFDADRAALLTEVVVAVGQRFGVAFDRLHNDSTSIALLRPVPRRQRPGAARPHGAGHHLRLLARTTAPISSSCCSS